LASHGKFVEKPEDYGALFQWGRKGDGHEQRTCLLHSGTVSSGFDSNGQILSGQPAYGKFINASSSPFDWRSPKIDNLWDSGTESSPVKTANDPCPTGWRVPTKDELKSLIDSGSECKPDFNGESGRLFGSGANNIFLPAAGARSGYDG